MNILFISSRKFFFSRLCNLIGSFNLSLSSPLPKYTVLYFNRLSLLNAWALINISKFFCLVSLQPLTYYFFKIIIVLFMSSFFNNFIIENTGSYKTFIFFLENIFSSISSFLCSAVLQKLMKYFYLLIFIKFFLKNSTFVSLIL